MRTQLLKRGLILTTIGTILILFGTLTGNTQTTIANESVYEHSYTYSRLDIQEYNTTTNLQPGTYEMQYSFISNETINQYYVIILDPDGSELASILGPPPAYDAPKAITFQTQRAGVHTLILGGRWTTVQITIDKQTQVVKTTYPYEITIYMGIVLFITGVPLSLLGASIKEKRQPQWYD